MKKEIIEKIEGLVEETPAVSFHKGLNWNGFEVFELNFKKNSRIGLPLVILVNGDEVRFSTSIECFEYFDYCEQKKQKRKSIGELKEDIQEEI